MLFQESNKRCVLSVPRYVLTLVAMMALVASSGIATDAGGDQPTPDDAAVKRVLALGGTVQIDVGPGGRVISGIQLPNRDATDEDASWLSKVGALRTLNLSGSQISDKGLIELGNLRNLEALDLFPNRSHIGSNGLAVISSLAKLRSLKISYFQISKDSLEALGSLHQLRDLLLAGPGVFTADDISQLCAIRGLEKLTLIGGTLTDNGIRELASMSRLVELNLTSMTIERPGLQGLSKISTLRNLELGYNPDIRDADMESIAECRQLESLRVCSDRLTDGVFDRVRTMSNLRDLSLLSHRVSGKNIEQLADLPQLSVLVVRLPELTDNGLNQLAKLKRLRHLSVLGSKIEERDLRRLRAALPSAEVDGGEVDFVRD